MEHFLRLVSDEHWLSKYSDFFSNYPNTSSKKPAKAGLRPRLSKDTYVTKWSVFLEQVHINDLATKLFTSSTNNEQF